MNSPRGCRVEASATRHLVSRRGAGKVKPTIVVACVSSLRARSPRAEKRGKVGRADDAVAVEVDAWKAAAIGAPEVQHDANVGRVHDAVGDEVGGARFRTTIWKELISAPIDPTPENVTQ